MSTKIDKMIVDEIERIYNEDEEFKNEFDKLFPPKKVTILLASSPTLDGIKICLEQYFYSEKELKEISPTEWQVLGTKSNFRVIKKGKRFRFEAINN
ncbi:hypothetical protein CLV62_104104 [Dysgonomonas alginatilytica]|uniref:Uncharacterized protein n=1 Tax=Dysgonomonas alginatilytica TaxID=1605892 RepID=A0A2V3PT92_9BACT|nr:hypothetical protein [Dysgonomonas alginatilytica]PXV66843.1 hypothetical protein CLV62_104104 [Dysgonomonas alginatilytica]